MPTFYYAPSFYNITITNNNGGSPQAAPNDGFIDNTTVEEYVNIYNAANPGAPVSLETGLSGFTLAKSTAKARANARWRRLNLFLNQCCNIIIDPNTITTTGSPSWNAEPASISFLVMVEKGDPSLQTWDELNPTQLLTDIDALNRFVVRALTNPPVGHTTTPATDISLNLVVYDPTATKSNGASVTIPRNFYQTISVDVGPVVIPTTNVVNDYATALGLIS